MTLMPIFLLVWRLNSVATTVIAGVYLVHRLTDVFFNALKR
ncbi:hypothetical protein JCM19240_576 [Vibrio maritimus]|uniref:Uncharacterized protein n=1 Tax=Vibrio maritimus TaxID=990268 RepID=A0A090TAF5_9VIBR|nr:hypothetical protein JCM19240_576 [Vibrio maritimus]